MDTKKIQDLIVPVIESLGCEFVDVRVVTEMGRKILRVLVDYEGGVSVGQCEKISREIETLLEVEGVIGDRCLLEVSSPGLDRPLVKESDFVRFTGKVAAIRTREAMDPVTNRRNYKGLLKGVEDGSVVIEVDGQEYKITQSLIEKANLVF